MTGIDALGFGGIFVASAALSLLLVPLALRLAVRGDALDRPGGYKQQAAPVPYLGGVAMLVAFSAAVIAAAVVRPPVAGFSELVVILSAAVVLSLMGLLDDLRGLWVVVRLLVVTAAGTAVWFAGTQITLAGVPWIDGVLTVLWVVGITNAMNLLDNMDGLSAGVATIASATFFVVAVLNGQFLVAALSLALAGCALGFLRHNRYPARIYMGDAGSLFLGFMLAVIGIRLRLEAGPPIAVFVPVLVLAVPILDTALVTITRLRAGRSPFAGGSDHTSHRLVRLGLPVPGAVAIVYAASIFSSWLAIAMSRQTDVVSAYLILGFWATLMGFGGWLLVRTTPPTAVAKLADSSQVATSQHDAVSDSHEMH